MIEWKNQSILFELYNFLKLCLQVQNCVPTDLEDLSRYMSTISYLPENLLALDSTADDFSTIVVIKLE